MRVRLSLLAIAGFWFLPSSVWQPDANVDSIVGVVESVPCMRREKTKLRPLFLFEGGQWSVLSDSAQVARAVSGPITWVLATQGQSAGSVQTIDPRRDTDFAWRFPQDRGLSFAASAVVPRILNTDTTATFTTCGSSDLRPVIAVAFGSIRDPDLWKVLIPSDTLRRLLFPSFRRAVPPESVVVCPTGKERPVNFNYRWQDLQIVKGARDKSGNLIIAIELKFSLHSCEGFMEDAWQTQWFAVGDRTVFLGRSLEWLGAGDFAGDGQSELMFSYSGSEEEGDGFTMYFDHFRQHRDIRWTYH